MSFMPGMFPGIAAAGAAAAPTLDTITQVLSAISTNNTITWPATLASGDLAVLFDAAVNSTTPTPSTVVPTGFSSIINSNDGSSARNICSYKILTGSESGSLTGMNGGTNNRKVMLVFRGNIAITSVTIVSPSGQVTSANPTAQVVSSLGVLPPLITFGAYSTQAGATVSPRNFTPAKDSELGPNNACWLAWKIYNAADTPADITIDMDDEGDFNGLQSFSLELAA